MGNESNNEHKVYYTIHEVAQKYGVSDTLLRYWEREIPQLAPRRVGRGVRQYNESDVRLVGVIYDLVKVRGMKISAVKQQLLKNKKGVYDNNAAVDKLREIRAQLVELRANLKGIVRDKDYELDLNLPDDER